jgi:hypothetical protein
VALGRIAVHKSKLHFELVPIEVVKKIAKKDFKEKDIRGQNEGVKTSVVAAPKKEVQVHD